MGEIVRAARRGDIPNAEVGCVIASTADAGGIERAIQLGVPRKDVLVVDPRAIRTPEGKIDRDAFAQILIAELRARAIDVVTQNGWLPMTPVPVIREYLNRIFNQHPGPVPEFGGKGMYGLRVHAAVIEFLRLTGNSPITEVIAQYVGDGYDEGGVVGSARIAVLPDDTAEILQARALSQEHCLQIQLLKNLARGRTLEVIKRPAFAQSWQQPHVEAAKKHGITLYPHG